MEGETFTPEMNLVSRCFCRARGRASHDDPRVKSTEIFGDEIFHIIFFVAGADAYQTPAFRTHRRLPASMATPAATTQTLTQRKKLHSESLSSIITSNPKTNFGRRGGAQTRAHEEGSMQ